MALTPPLPEAWAEYMLAKVETWEQAENHASGSRLLALKSCLKSLETKLDTLIDLHLSGDIERESYLKKKDALMREKVSLHAKTSAARAERKEWVEPLRQWILDSKRSGFLSSSSEYTEIRDFVRTFGTNPSLFNKTITISFCSPSLLVRHSAVRGDFSSAHAPAARRDFSLSTDEVALCDELVQSARNYFESRSD